MLLTQHFISVTCFRHVKGRVFVALADGTVAIFHRAAGQYSLGVLNFFSYHLFPSWSTYTPRLWYDVSLWSVCLNRELRSWLRYLFEPASGNLFIHQQVVIYEGLYNVIKGKSWVRSWFCSEPLYHTFRCYKTSVLFFFFLTFYCKDCEIFWRTRQVEHFPSLVNLAKGIKVVTSMCLCTSYICVSCIYLIYMCLCTVYIYTAVPSRRSWTSCPSDHWLNRNVLQMDSGICLTIIYLILAGLSSPFAAWLLLLVAVCGVDTRTASISSTLRKWA